MQQRPQLATKRRDPRARPRARARYASTCTSSTVASTGLAGILACHSAVDTVGVGFREVDLHVARSTIQNNAITSAGNSVVENLGTADL